MNKKIRKGIMIGLGITALASSKIEKEARRLSKEYKITPQESKKLAKEFLSDMDKYRDKALDAIEREATKAEKALHAKLKKTAKKAKSKEKVARKTIKKRAKAATKKQVVKRKKT